MRSEMKILFKNLYAEQILVSIAFHTIDQIFGTNSNFKKIYFSHSDSLQAFKRELKQFLLSVELNDLEILK